MEERHIFKHNLAILLSFVVGMVLQIVPLPHVISVMRPQWVLVLLIFWTLYPQSSIGLIIAFILGLFMDLLTGSLLGQQALIYVFIVHLVRLLGPRLRMYPMHQQMGIVFVLALVSLAIQSWVLRLTGVLPLHWSYWLPALTSCLIWPIFYPFLKERYEAIRGYG